MLEKTLKKLLEEEERLCADSSYGRALPENCYFIGDGVMLCYPRTTGDSRYPYSADGFTLWAYSSGYLSLNESTFYYILPADEGKEPYCAFFGGIREGDGYIPLSVTGVARNYGEKVKRFTVYTPEAVYYVAKTKDVAYCVRAYVSPAKEAAFSLCALNLGDKKVKTYLSAFFNCLLMHQCGESVETKWFKQCKLTPHGFMFESVEDLDRVTHLKNYGVINRTVRADVQDSCHTCSRADYTGGKTYGLGFATPLRTGKFEKCAPICKFGDTAAAGDIYEIELDGGGFARVDYLASAYFNEEDAFKAVREESPLKTDDILRETIARAGLKRRGHERLEMKFGNFDGDLLNGGTFTDFAANVCRQVEFAALAKNSGVSLLGVRDVVQQIEAAQMWNPASCRAKYLELFNFIDPCGRCPRQYSLPAKGALPRMDTREFIDQGPWIISAIYNYLAFTGDYSILDEECGYYRITGRNTVEAVDERNSVGEHLLRITEYLISNIDPATGCLKALYGDWNDALDGLGVPQEAGKEFGSGVSVMATLQLYGNLNKILEIIEVRGDKFGRKAKFEHALATLRNGLTKFAVETKDGHRKILHGWGDNRAYLVGSFKDVDGVSRDGLTANAFWAISGAYDWDRSIKKDILASYRRLDGKYGLKTFAPHFEPDCKGVGRIVNLPKGTAENGATYVHAAMFGIWSLFAMGEGKLAWEQLYKVLPITHKLITTTPFIMSNSYAYNEELGLDGESMSDWFTGSANALVKALVWYVFGIVPDLHGVTVCPCAYMPFDSAQIELCVKNKRIKLVYCRQGGERKFTCNGALSEAKFDQNRLAPKLYIKTEDLHEGDVIVVTD